MRQPFSINAFLYQITDGEIKYLLLKRIQQPGSGLPAFWQGVTGGMEDGESFSETAAREIYEETGYQPVSINYIGRDYSFAIRDEWRDLYGPEPSEILEKVYCAEVSGGPDLSNEHSEYKWLSKTEALALLHFESNKEALKAADDWLTADKG